MGIPRLTQDLQPYLENATLSAEADIAAGVAVQSLVIDGPSMVYHIYGRILSDRLAQTDVSTVCDVPTYSLLNIATQQFLLDIEIRGIEM